MLSSLGARISQLFGEPEHTDKRYSYMDEAYASMAGFYKVCDLLPYDSFDETNHLFYNHDSMGFVIETQPLVGASEEMQKEISNLFALVLPDKSSLQVLLWADPCIGDQTQAYVDARDHAPDILKELAKRRGEYLKTFAFDSPFKPYGLRNFRCILSFSLPRGHSAREDMQTLARLKEQITTTLSMLNLPVWTWQPSDLLSTLEGILHMNPTLTRKPHLQWNRLQSLSSQFSNSESNLVVGSQSLFIRDHAMAVRTYSVRQFPSIWSLHAMGELIGDLDRDQAQLPCPFMIHYGIHIPDQDKPRTRVMAKATYVERQAFSPMGKYLSDIQRESQELQFVRESMGKGERIVQTQFGVILFAKPAEMDQAEQTLINLFTSKDWKLEANRFLHLPMFLTSLPMMWGEGRVNALLTLQKLKTTLSTESANLLPLQGEWKGTPTPGMILAGRRGQLFTWHPFDNDAGNYNACVVGRSGSGKSVFMQELMTSTLGLGGRVFVLDVGRSFEKTCFEGSFGVRLWGPTIYSLA